MSNARSVAVILCVLLGSSAYADDIPVIGRPVELPFSEASAGFVRRNGELFCPFRVEVAADSASVEVEKAIVFTLTIHAEGEVRQPPVRLDLRELTSFSRSFHVEDITDGKAERPTPTSWRWVYRLKPRRAGIDEIPRVPFAFYNPDLRPVEKAFQVIWTDPVPITVHPPERRGVVGPVPDRILTLHTGPALLADTPAWSGPGPLLLTSTLVVPPLASCVWLLVWRRLYPDAARRAQQRRSRAASRALSALNRAVKTHGRPRADAVARAVVGYLRERFDLSIAEPTPVEADAFLTRQGVSEPIREQLRTLLAECTAERFAPDEPGIDPLERARQFIAAIEEPMCPPSS